jgi:hypothetical protein
MATKFKINVTLFLCATLIYRLLLINIDIISTSVAANADLFNKTPSIFSTVIHQGVHVERHNESKRNEYNVAELCEEGASKDNKFKLHPFLLSHFFYSIITDNLNFKLEKTSLLYHHFCNISSHRYIALQVFRI